MGFFGQLLLEMCGLCKQEKRIGLFILMDDGEAYNLCRSCYLREGEAGKVISCDISK